MQDPNDYCTWTSNNETDNILTECGRVIEIYDYVPDDTCPSCNAQVLEDYSSDD
jgi:hypothetical protein